MPRMMLAYALAGVLFVFGAAALGSAALAVFEAGLAALALQIALGAGALAAGRVALGQGRRLRRRVEAGHHRQLVADLARRRGGLLEAADVSRLLNVAPPEAQRLLEDLARSGQAEIDVTESGQTLFRFDDRPLLGP